MKWNIFSDEVATERNLVRDYGFRVKSSFVVWEVENRVKVEGYKAQALREMAKRQILEERLIEQKKAADMIINILDGVDAEALTKLNGYSIDEINRAKESLSVFN